MRVLVISHSAVVDIYRQKFHILAQLGCEIHLVLPPAWPEGNRWITAPSIDEESGIFIHELKAGGLGRVGGFYLKGIKALITRLKPNIIHLEEEPFSLVAWQVFRQARWQSIPIVFFTWENILRKYKLPLNLIDNYVIKKAKWAIAGNQAGKTVLYKRGFKGKVEVIPQYGVDTTFFKSLPKEKSGQSEKIYTIGYLGRLLVEKGILTLLKAVKEINFVCKLLIVGAGEYQTKMREHIEAMELNNKVTIFPAVSNSDMPKILNQLYVLVLPSETTLKWKEQFGRVLVEAMACEIPVIGSDSGEIPQVIEAAGLIFPEKDYQSLAKKLTRVYSDQALAKQLAQRGRERVVAKFTNQKIAEATLVIYKNMLSQSEVCE